MTKVKRGLIVGRFQPYHLGHHNAIKKILKEVDELVIVIGSSKESYQVDNPFTAGERYEMIARALKKEGLYDRCYIVPVADIEEYALWTNRISSYTPRFDVVYSNNPLVKELFKAEDVIIKKMVSEHKDTDAVNVRRAMIAGLDWKKMVPPVIADYLNEIGAVKRLKALVEEEKKE